MEIRTESAADTLGIESAGNVSGAAIAEAVVNDLNTSGGMLGRRIEPVLYYFDTAEANPDRTVEKTTPSRSMFRIRAWASLARRPPC